jgi:aspartyl/asparaginyl beta-hydroxylase (cupin superfamily)
MPSPADKIRETIKGAVKPVVISAITAYSRRLYEAAGGEHRPVFYDVRATAPGLLEVDKQYLVIRKEVEALLGSGVNLPRYHDVAPGQVSISAGAKKWKVFVFDMVGAKPKISRKLCPKTAAILDNVPDLFQAFFSILEAGKSIPAHNGPFYGAIRYHLGLVVPKENPPTIRIKDQFYTWKEGESFMFDDTWNHEVFNTSSEDRVILLVDVMRPLPRLLDAVNRLYSKVFLRLAIASKIMKNVDQFR